jgi:outer membrane immunogenic protein
MKRNIIGVLAVSTLLIAAPLSGANAADMPLKVPPPQPVPVSSWSGCYIGANTGGAWADKNITLTNLDGVPLVGGPFSLGSIPTSGWAYGGQIGCDAQINHDWVVGIRGMWDGANMKGSITPAIGAFAFDETDHIKINQFGTIVGKFGYLLNPTLQLYGLAGVAWVHDHYFTNVPVFGELVAGSQTRSGYDVGAGLSWMFWRNWDLWVEYDYMGFGTKSVTLNGEGIFSTFTFGVDVKQSVSKVLLGLDYRFDLGMTPMSAKY